MSSTKFHSSSNMNKIVCFISQNKVDLLILNFLGFITIFSSIFLLQFHAEFMYNIDPYIYYSLALFGNDDGSNISSSYVMFLSFLLQVFPDTDQLLHLRTLNTIFIVQIVFFIYLIGRKIFNPFFSTVGALLVSFSPLLTTFSINLHNDTFAIAMGFTALFFMIKPKSINMIIGILLITVSGLARPDVALMFVVPLIISLAYFASKKIGIRFIYFFILGFIAFLSLGFFLSQIDDIYSSRFSFPERIMFFLNFDTIKTVFNAASAITQFEFLNNFFSGVLLVSLIVFLVNYRKKILKFFTLMGDNFDSGKIAAFYLSLVFVFSLISAATLHVGYSIDEEDLLIIKENIADRYVILSQILILFGFTLVISIFSASGYLVKKLKDKRFQSRINYGLKN